MNGDTGDRFHGQCEREAKRLRDINAKLLDACKEAVKRLRRNKAGAAAYVLDTVIAEAEELMKVISARRISNAKDDLAWIRLALCDPDAPWCGSDIVPRVADLCDFIDALLKEFLPEMPDGVEVTA